MEGLKFTLSGKTAFFKKPDVNVNTYFTYNNIHKVSLLGLLGAIIGLKGHIQQAREIKENKGNIPYPEFYEKLRNLKVAVVPEADKGYFTKKVQIFNNGVGYASFEKGGNLVVREQWLENPKWDIYLLNDSYIGEELFQRLKYNLENNQCKYIPYLGKNDHQAVISDYSYIDQEELKRIDNVEQINSLFLYENFKIGKYTYNEDNEAYFLKEFLPVSLSETYNFYEFKEFSYTNLYIEETYDKENIFKYKDSILYFF